MKNQTQQTANNQMQKISGALRQIYDILHDRKDFKKLESIGKVLAEVNPGDTSVESQIYEDDDTIINYTETRADGKRKVAGQPEIEIYTQLVSHKKSTLPSSGTENNNLKKGGRQWG